MAIAVAGLVSLIVFYLAILVVGIIAGRKTARAADSDEMFLANRKMGWVVALFTLTATMVGGGFINGTAETMYKYGFLWTQAPIGYNLSLIIDFQLFPFPIFQERLIFWRQKRYGGFCFAEKVRRAGYVTLFDPFQLKYGKRLGSLLFIPQLLGDLFWTASILSALGASLSVIMGLEPVVAIVISACIVIFYTFFGGLYSVAYTDVIQMFCIALGLFIAFPFALKSEAVDLSRIRNSWTGKLQSADVGIFIDNYLLLIMGGIPWQTYFQRVLACRTPQIAKWASIGGGIAAAIQAIPPMAIGASVLAADLKNTSFGDEIQPGEVGMVLPIGLQYLCPTAVSVIGLGAVSAAVMSSADSCVLSTGSVFTHNIWKNIIRPNASNREQMWVLRISIVVAGTIGTIISIFVHSIYGLFFLCSDLIYVINFPQLVCVLWLKVSNTYGYLAGYFVGLILRITGGEPLLSIPALVKYPLYDERVGQRFPFKTCAMLASLVVICVVSFVTDHLFRRGILNKRYDVLDCIVLEDERPESLRQEGSFYDRKAPLATQDVPLSTF